MDDATSMSDLASTLVYVESVLNRIEESTRRARQALSPGPLQPHVLKIAQRTVAQVETVTAVMSSVRHDAAVSTRRTVAHTEEVERTAQSAGISVEEPLSAHEAPARPALYPARFGPRARLDALDAHRFGERALLDELRLDAYQGLYNLCALLLIVTLLGSFVASVREHGLRATLPSVMAIREVALSLSIVSAAAAWTLVTHALVSLVATGALGWTALAILHCGAQLGLVVVPCALVVTLPVSPLAGAMTVFGVLTLVLKSHSYVMCNYAMDREARERDGSDDSLPVLSSNEASDSSHMMSALPLSPSRLRSRRATAHESAASPVDSGPAIEKGGGKWPANVTLTGFAYFVAAPTLVYEPRYPRSRKTRWQYVAHKAAEGAIALALAHVVACQHILPILAHSDSTPTNAGVLRGLHVVAGFGFDLMRITVPSILCWLLVAYAFFHAWLNLLAEVLRFADREFFKPFWNATTVSELWRGWNTPVHNFALRHVVVEMREYVGASRNASVVTAFVISAIAHEVIFSVSFHTLRPYFLLGMLAQLPLQHFGKELVGRRRGNFLVWMSIFLGQPLLELLYMREWFQTEKMRVSCS